MEITLQTLGPKFTLTYVTKANKLKGLGRPMNDRFYKICL